MGIVNPTTEKGKGISPCLFFSRYLSVFHQTLFALTLTFFVVATGLVWVYRGAFSDPDSQTPSNYFLYWYFFLRASVRFNSFFAQDPRSAFGITVTFLTIVFTLGVVLLLVFAALQKTRYARTLFDPVSGSILLSIFPLGVLLTSGFDPIALGLPAQRTTSLMILLFISIVSGSLFLTRKWVFPVWLCVVFPVAYGAFFAWVYYGRYSWFVWLSNTRLESLNAAFPVVASVTGWAWMSYARASRRNLLHTFPIPSKRILLLSSPWLAVFLIPWLPLGNHRVAQVRNIDQVAISLQRSSCFGSCPVYTVVLYGTGSVVYRGDLFVGTRGPATATIAPEKVRNLLQSFDREHFFSMEDKAFPNCFDTPYTTIRISADGVDKTVTGDTCHSASWPKSGLHKLGKEIDAAAGSSQWVQCHGNDCVRR